MSVINQMLKDLDKRQHTHGVEPIPTAQLQYQAPVKNSNRSKLFGFVVITILLAAIAVMGYQLWRGKLEVTPSALVDDTPIVSSGEEIAAAKKAGPSIPQEPAQYQASKETEADKAVKATGLLVAKSAEAQLEKSVAIDSLQTNTSTAEPTLVTRAVTSKEASQSELTKPVSALTNSGPTPAKTSSDAQPQQLKPAIELSQTPKQLGVLANQVKPKANSQPPEVQATKAVKPVASTPKMTVKEVKLSPKELGQKSQKVAQRAEKQGHLDEAIRAYINTLSHDAANHQTRKQLAALYYGRNQLKQATTVLTQGLVLYPDNVEFSLLLSRVQQASDAYLQAIATLSGISDYGEFARQKWLQQTDLAQKVQDNTLAEQAYRNLARVEPNQGRWWMGLAHALDSQKKYVDAKAAYRFALSKPGLSTQAISYIEKRLSQLGESK